MTRYVLWIYLAPLALSKDCSVPKLVRAMHAENILVREFAVEWELETKVYQIVMAGSIRNMKKAVEWLRREEYITQLARDKAMNDIRYG